MEQKKPTTLKKQIEDRLKEEFKDAIIDLKEVVGGCGTSFTLDMTWEGFSDMSRLARHRRVNGAIKEEMPKVHALQMVCTVTLRTPTEQSKVAAESPAT
ncbi:hypothetical protein H4R18_002155 [Coemansia javaensis]|uniref:Bola-like protein n=1 Tax=Coemansia javaensis TaxID=2761396 RepID=A0A9W8LKB8_9FUNG|nr:hypothetical protein H4R18_002155 [Coemansia javaensis]